MKITPAVKQILWHALLVFAVAFGAPMLASLGAHPTIHISAVLAALSAGAAAGVTAVLHYVLGLVPQGVTTLGPNNELLSPAVKLKIESRLQQVVVSILATFASILGAGLLAGATHVTSLPDLTAVVLAAISAAVAGAVNFAVGLIPAPKVPSTA